jgi:hypothetical protein
MAILTPKRYLNQDFKIPFYEGSSEYYKLKLKVSPRLTTGNRQTRDGDLKDKALRYYVINYLPEFYTYFYDEGAFQQILDDPDPIPESPVQPRAPWTMDNTISLMSNIRRSIRIENYFNASPPTSNKSVVVFKTNFDFLAKRDELESSRRMPSFEQNYEFFRTKNNVTAPTSATTLAIASLGTQNNSLNDGLRAFHQQVQGFEGQLTINLDFSYTQMSCQLVLNWMVNSLVGQLRRTGDARLTEADTLTLEFGKKNNKLAIVGMSYLLVEESIQNSPLKVGLFSAILYKSEFHDPMTVVILQNYSTLVERVQDSSFNPDTPAYTVWQFLDSPSVGTSLSGSFGDNFGTFGSLGDLAISGSGIVPLPRPLSPAELAAQHKLSIEAQYVKAAKDLGIISVTDVKALSDSFSAAYSSEEMIKLREEISRNPEVRRRVLRVQTTKGFVAAATAASLVEDILANPLMPLGLIGKANPAVGRLIRSLGIDQLLKEVMLCLTFGANFEASRIASAVKTALHQQALSMYYREPPLPREYLEIPKFDFKSLKPKLRDLDIGNLIKQAVISAMQSMALEVIKKLAELIREACTVNNPFSGDYGANNINNLLTTGVEDGLAGLATKNGLHPSVVRQYLAALSQILSSVDVCNLLNPLGKPPQSLINRIIAFNQSYDNIIIQQQLTTITSLMGFISDLSGITDVSDLCDEIANAVFVLNQADVCLQLADAPDLGDLFPTVPELNFDCMDRQNFINDPTITKAIPEVFNAVAETIEIQFISSAESIKEILLDPILVRGTNSNVLASLDAAGQFRPMEASGSLDEPDPDVLRRIQESISEVMATLQGPAEVVENLFSRCDPSMEEVLGFDPGAFGDVFAALVESIASALATSQFNSGLQDISNDLSSLGAGDGPVVRTYRFKQEFYRDFQEYVQTSKSTYVDNIYTAPRHFNTVDEPYIYDGPAQAVPFGSEALNPLRIRFNFPATPPSTAASPVEEYLQITYPPNIPALSQLAELEFASTSNLVFTAGSLSDLQDELLTSTTEGDGTSTSEINKYIQQFIENYADSMWNFAVPGLPSTARAAGIASATDHVVRHVFPKVYATLLENMFRYIIENGAFNAATIKSMQLFHLNEACPPDKVADLLDVQGILEQMTREYAEQACNDRAATAREKVRRIIKLGLLLLLIQVSLAEIIIKNIFVFAAFNMESMLTDRNGFLFKFIKAQAVDKVLNFIQNPPEKRPPILSPENLKEVKNDLLSYFSKKIVRPSVIANGGIRYSSPPEDIAFPTGTIFSNTSASPNSPEPEHASFKDILDYLVSERLHFAARPMNNTLDRALAKSNKFPRTPAEALVSTYRVLESSDSIPASLGHIQRAAQISFGHRSTVFILDEADSSQVGTWGEQIRRAYSLWYYSGLDDEWNSSSPDPGETPDPEEPEFGTGQVMPLIHNLYSYVTSPPAGELAPDEVPMDEPDEDPYSVTDDDAPSDMDMWELIVAIQDIFASSVLPHMTDLYDPGSIPGEVLDWFVQHPHGSYYTDSSSTVPIEVREAQLNQFVTAYLNGNSSAIANLLGITPLDLLADEMSNVGINMSAYISGPG